MALPIEVCERIIDMVGDVVDRWDNEGLQERVYNLLACTLVARLWVPRSRLQLLRDITLRSNLRTKSFLNVVSQSPARGRYVEVLRIWPLSNEESNGWIFQALSALPPFLSHLRELGLYFLPVLHPVCIAIVSRFSTVETLMLFGLKRQSLGEIVRLINQFPRLQRLHVRSCLWKLPGRCYSGKQHNLALLDMWSPFSECERSFLEWALESGSTRTLTIFRAHSDVAGSAMDCVLQTCRSMLRELHLNSYSDDGPSEVPLLTNHLAVQRLTLRGFSQQIISVLARLPFLAPSSRIGILVVLFGGITGKYGETIPENEWKTADLALCDSKFPCLTSIEFRSSSKQLIRYPQDLLQRMLPNSYERGIIWLQDHNTGRRTLLAPEGAPHYPGLPLEWEISRW